MAKPRGHKARTARQAGQKQDHGRDADVVRKFIEPPAWTVRCQCAEDLEFPTVVPRTGIVYRLTCRMCGHHQFLQWDVGTERVLLPQNYSGPSKHVESHTFTPVKALTRWWNAMPGEEHGGPAGDAWKKMRARAEQLISRKRNPLQDSAYLKLRQERNEALERMLDGYATIDRTVAERYRTASTLLRQREEALAAKGLESGDDPAMRALWRQMGDEGNRLINIWVKAGEKVKLDVARKGGAAAAKALVAVASAESRRDEGFARIHEQGKQHRLEQEAQAIALADKRGHLAPLVPSPWWIGGAVYEKALKSKKKLPVNTLKVDFAKLVRRDNPTTWPTLHHLVLAFAERGPVILAEIRNVSGSREKDVSKGRPVRYSPRVVRHLIRWWLAGPRRQSDEKIKEEFRHLLSLLSRRTSKGRVFFGT